MVEGDDPARPRRRLPAQHREPGPRVDRPLPPVRRRRRCSTDRLPRRAGRATATASSAPTGFVAEQDAAAPLWAGIWPSPGAVAKRDDGWGARGRMKDASSTDVVVHAGVALTSFYQCGDLYRLDPTTLDDAGQGAVGGRFPPDGRVGAPQGRRAHRRAAVLQLRQRARRTCTTAWSSADGELVHYDRRAAARPAAAARHGVHRALRDPQRPARCSGIPELLAQGMHLPRFHPDMPIAVRRHPAPRQAGDIRWFEAEPTYVLHWINAYEDGDEIVLDGFFQHDPSPPKPAASRHRRHAEVYRTSTLDRMQARPHRWRFNLVTGQTTEERLSDRDHGVRHDQRPVTAGGRTATRTACHRRAGLVPVRRPRASTTSTPARAALRVRRRRVRQRDPLAPRAGATPRTTATSSRSPPT